MTSVPGPGIIIETFERLADEGATEILAIHVAGSLSAMVNSARLASEEWDKVPVTVFDSGSGAADLWLYDIARQAKSRLTFDEANDVAPIWSQDGERIAFQSSRSGAGDIYVRQAGGGSAA